MSSNLLLDTGSFHALGKPWSLRVAAAFYIRGLLAAHPQVDISEARRWVREFATAMSMSDMLEEFDKLVAQRSPEP
jgi:hypothetical protein